MYFVRPKPQGNEQVLLLILLLILPMPHPPTMADVSNKVFTNVYYSHRTWARVVHARRAAQGLSRSSSTGTRRIQSSQSSLVAHLRGEHEERARVDGREDG